MTSNNDTELWTAMSREWQEISPPSDPPATALRAYVERHTRRLRLLLLLDIGVTAAAIVGVILLLAFDHGLFSILVSIDTGVVLAIVWTFSIVTGRGLWRASASSTTEYLALARRLTHRRLHTVLLTLALLVAQFTIVLLLFPDSARAPMPSLRFLPVAGAVAWSAWAIVTWRRARRELHAIDALERDAESMK